MTNNSLKTGKLAREVCGKRLPLQVLQSAAGFYVGTFDDEGPCSRESEEYFRSKVLAQAALDTGKFTQVEMDLPRGFHPQDTAQPQAGAIRKVRPGN